LGKNWAREKRIGGKGDSQIWILLCTFGSGKAQCHIYWPNTAFICLYKHDII